MSTKSFIINLPIITGDQDRRRLRKSFSFGCNLQNAVMGGGWDRVLRMRATPEWQAARVMPKGSERTKAFRDLRVRFRLSEYDFYADVAMHRKASGRGHLLGINECHTWSAPLLQGLNHVFLVQLSLRARKPKRAPSFNSVAKPHPVETLIDCLKLRRRELAHE